MGTTEMDEVDMVERWEAKKRDLEEAQLRRTFDGVDEDGSGEIEPPEFKRLCRRLDARRATRAIGRVLEVRAEGEAAGRDLHARTYRQADLARVDLFRFVFDHIQIVRQPGTQGSDFSIEF